MEKEATKKENNKERKLEEWDKRKIIKKKGKYTTNYGVIYDFRFI